MQSARLADPLPILVVDDDSALVRTLADILRLHGYAPAVAETGRAGLELAERRIPVLAVVDLRLPDMDGMELAARLHAMSERTEVVVLTGNASVESAVAALREHSIDYLLKPVQVDQLLHVVTLAGERWQRRQAEQMLRESDERFRRSLEIRARQQEAVAQLGQQALRADDMDELLSDSATLVANTLEVPFAGVFERRSDGTELLLRAGVGWSASDIGHLRVPVDEHAPAGFTLMHNRPTAVENLSREPRFSGAKHLVQRGIVAALAVAIPGPIAPYGVLVAQSTEPREFSRDDVHFLQAIAHVVGAAVERHRTEAALRQAHRLEAVGRLASGVAHDFNNMLSAITAYAEMVRGAIAAGDPMRDDVEEILKAAGRAAGLTRQLLAFSRQQVLQPRILRLNDVIVGMENMVRRLLGTDIQFECRLDPDLAWVKADPGQIEQVILNLCVNARDAMPHGGRLIIETRNAALSLTDTMEHAINGDDEYVMLAVSDTGTGMDAETRARIFEPFFTTKPPDRGTGLGLATVYGIVKQSGGEIDVYTEVGQGTSIKIFLPPTHELDVESAAPAAATPTHGNETIILAEDEESIRRVAQRVLERAGYRVLAAENGEQALEHLRNTEQVHLLVTDMIMPVMSGQELVEQARRLRPEVAVLYLSGYTDALAYRKGMIDGSAQFLQKPFGNEELVRKVREMLDAVISRPEPLT